MHFNEMSESFQRAFGYSSSKHYKGAIELYKKDLEENPKNIASMNNIAVAMINLGISESNQNLLHDAKGYLEKAIKFVEESKDYKFGFPIAEANLNWVNEILAK